MATMKFLSLVRERTPCMASPPRLFVRRTSIFTALRAFSAAALSPPSTAVVYDQQGPPDSVVRIEELPSVEIKDDDVCVRMLAAPINPSDINRIEGLLFFHFGRLKFCIDF